MHAGLQLGCRAPAADAAHAISYLRRALLFLLCVRAPGRSSLLTLITRRAGRSYVLQAVVGVGMIVSRPAVYNRPEVCPAWFTSALPVCGSSGERVCDQSRVKSAAANSL